MSDKAEVARIGDAALTRAAQAVALPGRPLVAGVAISSPDSSDHRSLARWRGDPRPRQSRVTAGIHVSTTQLASLDHFSTLGARSVGICFKA